MKDVNEQLKKHYDYISNKYGADRIFFICAYGSMNYNLFDDNSDVDTYAVIIPDISDIIDMDVVSTTLDVEGEHCVVKDIRLFFKELQKSNVNTLETLITEYYIANPSYIDDYHYLRRLAFYIARMSNNHFLRNCFGMYNQQYLDYELTGSGKSAANMYRMGKLILAYLNGRNLLHSYYVHNKFIKDNRRNSYTFPEENLSKYKKFLENLINEALFNDDQLLPANTKHFLKTILYDMQSRLISTYNFTLRWNTCGD